jgi:hypothetical protein
MVDARGGRRWSRVGDAAAASKRKNSSAWRLRQENQRMKTELAEKAAQLDQEFVGKQELRQAAQAVCERTKAEAAKVSDEPREERAASSRQRTKRRGGGWLS